jgi:UDP-N-acetylmuramyl pentapeptide phosphotransferase/UDP-N-acetylglucosamine-1-phosphate transferase
VLGIALAVSGVVGTLVFVLDGVDVGPEGWGIAAGCLLVFLTGLVDDLYPTGPRGFAGHLRALASGHMTTGILKLIVAAGSAIVVVVLLDRGGAVARISGVVLIAGATNVWNALDVRPGRALKWFNVVVLALIALEANRPTAFLVCVWPVAVVALVLDVRERAMLGDSGSNLLGFAVGAQLAASLPTWSLWIAAVAVVGLNVLADTFTFSRVIDAIPPLRWFDRLGRMAPVEPHGTRSEG